MTLARLSPGTAALAALLAAGPAWPAGSRSVRPGGALLAPGAPLPPALPAPEVPAAQVLPVGGIPAAPPGDIPRRVAPSAPAPVPDRTSPSRSETRRLARVVERRIARARARGKVPLVSADLDDTVFLHASRMTALLRDYDRANLSSFFDGVRPAELVGPGLAGLVRARLEGRLERGEVEREARRVLRFVSRENARPESAALDEPNPVVARRIRRWSRLGARIVYVTARTPAREEASRTALEGAGLPEGAIHLRRDQREPPPRYKLGVLRELSADPEVELVAHLDDDEAVVAALRAGLPEALIVRVRVEAAARRGSLRTRLE